MQIHVSIGDFAPGLKGLEYLFEGLQDTGVDGVELVVGVKSRWSARHCHRLAEKYSLPIVSLHQPLWSATGLYFDEGFFLLAKQLDAQRITCHPLPKLGLDDARMQAYLKHLASMQEKTGIAVLLENLPENYNNKLLNFLFPPKGPTGNFQQIVEAASKYGLGVTMDIDHLQLDAPHKAAWFEELVPKVSNIHLSSFDTNSHHLPVYMGRLQTAGFLGHLQACQYRGPVTLEVNYPSAITLFNYDFKAIRQSVDSIRQALKTPAERQR